MRYGSVCSGIEMATVAWHKLGWRPSFFSEIDKFPRAVLEHHYPDVPLHGDFTTIKDGDYESIDLLVGGTPCQDFSVAGLRAGITGKRGNLTLEFVRLAERLRPTWIVWENVPGVLSIDGGRAFGSFLGGLAHLGYGFAYRVLDAQFFGLAQRRERVFVVANLGDWRRAAAVLFEPEGLRGDPPPRRETGQKTAGTLGARTDGGGFPGTDEACDGYDVPVAGADVAPSLRAQAQASHRADSDVYIASVAPTLGDCSNGGGANGPGRSADSAESLIAFGGNNTSGPLDVATARSAHAVPHGRLDFESETFVVNARQDPDVERGREPPLGRKDTGHAFAFKASHFTRGKDGAPQTTAEPLSAHADKGDQDTLLCVPIAFSAKDHGADAASDSSPTLRAGGHAASHENGGVMPAVAIPLLEVGKRTGKSTTDPRACAGIGQDGDPMYTLQSGAQHGIALAFEPRFVRNGRGAPDDIASPLKAESGRTGKGDGATCVAVAYAVRRLTPKECCRLMGAPDNYLDIPYRGKPAADGPKYKALGNAFPRPVVEWIGRRIQMVEDLMKEGAA